VGVTVNFSWGGVRAIGCSWDISDLLSDVLAAEVLRIFFILGAPFALREILDLGGLVFCLRAIFFWHILALVFVLGMFLYELGSSLLH
jgi:hypothetical protein